MKYFKIIVGLVVIKIGFSFQVKGQVGINIITPQSTLDINGDLIVTQTIPTAGLFLGIDRANDGYVGTLISTPYIFAQSSQEQIFSATDLVDYNAARGVALTWNPATEIIHNALATFDSANNEFVFNGDYLCEISGYVCLKTGAPNTAGTQCYINIKIQRRRSGTATWEDVTATRALLNFPLLNQNTSTIIFTPCVAEYKTGDALRVLISRATATLGTPFGPDASGVALPGKMPYTRGLKVLSL